MSVPGLPAIASPTVWLDQSPLDRDLVGGKGASLSELAALGAPVPPAFAITAPACAAAAAPKDGYTVFVTTMSTQSVNLALYKKLPYDPQRDFTAVTVLALSPMLLVVRNTDDQPKTVAELVERIRRSTTPPSYASGNTSSQVAGASFLAQLDAKGIHVPYKGTPQGITDLLSGRIDFFFPDLTPVVPLVQAGRLRALAVTGRDRIGPLPAVPTMAEAGFPVNLVTWSGAFLPAGTPKPVVDRLYELMRAALTGPEYQAHNKRVGTLAGGLPPDRFAAFVKDEVAVWGDAVRAAGIEPE
mgnify:CR=1 FL=1